MEYTSPPGVFDIVPQDEKNPWKCSKAWRHVEDVLCDLAKAYGFQEIRTPIFEKTQLFSRSVGEETDIVSKEMYTFLDRSERSLTLRPEGTAPVARALIENRLLTKRELKVFYFGPMFRYERMQAGRYRQFHQFGIEAFGRAEPEQDAEIIALAYDIFRKLKIKGLVVKISTLGDKEARERFRNALVAYLEKHVSSLSEDSQRRLEKNPLRILDSKDAGDQKVLENAPSLYDYLSEAAQEHFEKVKTLLSRLKIPFETDGRLVRGLDYYESTVFEIVSKDLGAQNALGGGGRYDGLLEALGGERLPSIGFALGMERILQVMLKQGVLDTTPEGLELYLIPMGESAKDKAFDLIHSLRQEGLSADMKFSEGKVGKGFSRADELNAKYAAALGDRELENGVIELKQMATGEKFQVPFDELTSFLNQKRPKHV